MNGTMEGPYAMVNNASHHYDNYCGILSAPVPCSSSLDCNNGMSSLQHQHQQQHHVQQQHKQQHHHHHHHHHLSQHTVLNNNELMSSSAQGGYVGQTIISPCSVVLQNYAMPTSMTFQPQLPSGLSATNGINIQGTQGNIQSNIFIPLSDVMQTKYLSINDVCHSQQEPRTTELSRSFPITIEPNSVPIRCRTDKLHAVSPLRPQRKVNKGRKENHRYDCEASTSSLRVDKIFVDEKNDETFGDEKNYNTFGDETNGIHDASSIKTKLNLSAMSIMSLQSLSIDGIDPNSLSTLLNASTRLGGHSCTAANPKTAPRRHGSGDGDSSINYEKGMASVFEMSVNTIGDEMSDFGDSAVMRMTESQAEMSFGNVFEDYERDVYVRGATGFD
jgi:hypothetical protein